jgi:hypothetical protein
LNVFDVAAAWSGAPSQRSRSATSRKVAFTCRRNAASCSRLGGSSGRKARVSRPAPSGSEMASSGSASLPKTISMEPPPMSITSSRARLNDLQLVRV